MYYVLFIHINIYIVYVCIYLYCLLSMYIFILSMYVLFILSEYCPFYMPVEFDSGN